LTEVNCEENIFFLEDVKKFKTLEEMFLLKAANKICNLYLRKNSFCEINFSRNKLKEFLDSLQQGKVSKSIFQDIAYEVEWSIDAQRISFLQKEIPPRRKVLYVQ
jgi:hypothetical protein